MFLSTPEPLDRTVFTAAATRKSRTAPPKNLIREDRSFRRNQGPTTTKSGLPGYAWVVGKFIGPKHYLPLPRSTKPVPDNGSRAPSQYSASAGTKNEPQKPFSISGRSKLNARF